MVALKNNGFTIVELLVIIVVIAILASISVVGYGRWRERTAETEAKSELNTIIVAMKNERNFKNAYPTSLPSTYTPNKDLTVNFLAGYDSEQFCIEVKSKQYPSVYQVYSYDHGNINRAGCVQS